MIHKTTLPSLDPSVLAGYLAALGVQRLLTLHDPAVKMAWETHNGKCAPIYISSELTPQSIYEIILGLAPEEKEKKELSEAIEQEKQARSKVSKSKGTSESDIKNWFQSLDALSHANCPRWMTLDNKFGSNPQRYRAFVEKALIEGDDETLAFLAAITSDGWLEEVKENKDKEDEDEEEEDQNEKSKLFSTTTIPALWQIVRNSEYSIPSGLSYCRAILADTTKEELLRAIEGDWVFQDQAKYSLRWHPILASYALSFSKPDTEKDPNTEKGLNRLALEALPCFPCFQGDSPSWLYVNNQTTLVWALWSAPIELPVATSLISRIGKLYKQVYETKNQTDSQKEHLLKSLQISHIYKTTKVLTGKYLELLPAKLIYRQLTASG